MSREEESRMEIKRDRGTEWIISKHAPAIFIEFQQLERNSIIFSCFLKKMVLKKYIKIYRDSASGLLKMMMMIYDYITMHECFTTIIIKKTSKGIYNRKNNSSILLLL